MPHTTIRKVRLEGGTGGYRTTGQRAYHKYWALGLLFCDGVDGDEDANTVTYYYTRYRSLAEAEDSGRFVGRVRA